MSEVISLRDRIKVAKSAADVASLLSEGKTYKYATPKTQRSWQIAAKSRLAALETTAPAAEPKVKVKKPRAKKAKE